MLQRSEKVKALLPELARTDREVSELVQLALHCWAGGEKPATMLCQQLHVTEAEHALRSLDCYVSDEDAALVERLSEVLPELVEWAVAKGWAWRQA